MKDDDPIPSVTYSTVNQSPVKMPRIVIAPWTTCLCPKDFYQPKGWFCSIVLDNLVTADGEGMTIEAAQHEAFVDFRKKVEALVECTPKDRLDTRLARAFELLDEFNSDLEEK